MKKGCITLLAMLIGLTFLYNSRFPDTALAGKWWVALLLAFGVCITFANIYGIVLAVRQKIAGRKQQRDWRDGDYVGLSGKIQAVQSPITAPISGKSVVIVEYEIKRESGSGKNRTKMSELSGMIMAPCAIHTTRGKVRVVGFPLLATIPPSIYDQPEDISRVASYITSTQFKEKPGNPFKLMEELSSILADDDGELKVDYMDKNSALLHCKDYPQEEFEDWNDDQEEDADEEQENSARESAPPSAAEAISRRLQGGSYWLEETAILPGDQVTLFGTYKSAKQAIDIGSGIKNLKHTFHLGTLDAVVGKNLRRSFIATLIFGAITVYGHMHVAKMIGLLE